MKTKKILLIGAIAVLSFAAFEIANACYVEVECSGGSTISCSGVYDCSGGSSGPEGGWVDCDFGTVTASCGKQHTE